MDMLYHISSTSRMGIIASILELQKSNPHSREMILNEADFISHFLSNNKYI